MYHDIDGGGGGQGSHVGGGIGGSSSGAGAGGGSGGGHTAGARGGSSSETGGGGGRGGDHAGSEPRIRSAREKAMREDPSDSGWGSMKGHAGKLTTLGDKDEGAVEDDLNTAQKRRRITELDQRLADDTSLPTKSYTGRAFSRDDRRFMLACRDGTTWVCSACRELWFRDSLDKLPFAKLFALPPAHACDAKCLDPCAKAGRPSVVSTFGDPVHTRIPSDGAFKPLTEVDGIAEQPNEDAFLFCTTCTRHLSSRKVPPRSLWNGTGFPPRILAPVIPMMRVVMAPVGHGGKSADDGQWLLMPGGVINIPADIARTMAALLPRNRDEMEDVVLEEVHMTVGVELKRRLRYKGVVYAGKVDIDVLRRLVEYMKGMPLFSDIRFTQGRVIDWRTPEEALATQVVGGHATLAADPAVPGAPPPAAGPSSASPPTPSSPAAPVPTQDPITTTDPAEPPPSPPTPGPEIDMIAHDLLREDAPQLPVDAGTPAAPGARKRVRDAGVGYGVKIKGDSVLLPATTNAVHQTGATIAVAPGEGHLPIGYLGPFLEELVFVITFCGRPRLTNAEREALGGVFLKKCDQYKNDLYNKDRRVAGNAPNLFFKLNLLQMMRVVYCAEIAIRKLRMGGVPYTQHDVVDRVKQEYMVDQDLAFPHFRKLKGSLDYMNATGKQANAMLRQHGTPTWFFTLTSRGRRWRDLKRALALVVDGVHLSDADLDAMPPHEAERLIRSDPVTCDRMYNKRLDNYLGLVQQEHDMLGTVVGYMVGAPRYNPHGDNLDVLEYIDRFCACASDGLPPTLLDAYVHRHMTACHKAHRPLGTCRFHFPRYPMLETCILKGYPKEAPDPDHTQLNEMRLKVFAYMKAKETEAIKHDPQGVFDPDTGLFSIHSDPRCHDLKAAWLADPKGKTEREMWHDEWLRVVGVEVLEMGAPLPQEQYIKVVRTGLQAPAVQLRRRLWETNVNNYAVNAAELWDSNTDLQFVLEPYAAVVYVCSYMCKGQKGVCELVDALKETLSRTKDMTLYKALIRIGRLQVLLQQVGAQETVALLTGQRGKRSLHACLFVPTTLDADRIKLLKHNRELQKLDASSTDITQPGIKERFASRPADYHSYTYFQFAAWTEVRPGKSKMQTFDAVPEGDADDEDATLERPRNQSDDDTEDEQEEAAAQAAFAAEAASTAHPPALTLPPAAVPPPPPPPQPSLDPDSDTDIVSRKRPTALGKRLRPTGLDASSSSSDDPMQADPAPPPSPSPPPDVPYLPAYQEGSGNMEAMRFGSADWDDERYLRFLAEDWSKDWHQPWFQPIHVRHTLASGLCTPEDIARIGTGPAFSNNLSFDHKERCDPRNAGKPESEWVVLDPWARRRFNRHRDGPRPPEVTDKDRMYNLRLSARIIRSEHFDLGKDPEGHFREKVLGNTRWRTEDEALNGCWTWEARHAQLLATPPPAIPGRELFGADAGLEAHFKAMVLDCSQGLSAEAALVGAQTYQERYRQLETTPAFKARSFNAMSLEEFASAHDRASDFLQVEQKEDEQDAEELRAAMLDEEGREFEQREDLDLGFDLDRRGAHNITLEGRAAGLPGFTVTESHILQPDPEFFALVASQNARQTAYFNSAMKVVIDCPTGKPHCPNTYRLDVVPAPTPGLPHPLPRPPPKQLIQFVSGGAGSGKSRMLDALRQAIIRHYNKTCPPDDYTSIDADNNCPFLLVMAYTGAAAYNVRGETVNAGMHVGGRGEGGSWTTLDFSLSHINKMKASYKHLKFVMVDESSMLSNVMLIHMDAVFRETLDKTRPFGGLHVLFFGDLFQLQPIAAQYVFEPLYKDLLVFRENPWDLVTLFELTEIMRQVDDQQYAQSMNRLREGIHTLDDLAYWKEREICRVNLAAITDPRMPKQVRDILTKELLPPPFLPFVCPTNAGKQAKNDADLEAREGDAFSCIASQILDHGRAAVVDPLIAKQLVRMLHVETDPVLLAHQKNAEHEQKSLLIEFKVKVGSIVEVCDNYDKSDGLFNGACGVVKHVSCTTSTPAHPRPPAPFIIWVQFDDPTIGQKARARDNTRQADGSRMPATWTPDTGNKAYKFFRHQFPLAPAAGRTIHHVQGQSLAALGVSFLHGTWTVAGMVYVAFSRVQTYLGLFLEGFKNVVVKVSQLVVDEMQRLRQLDRQVELAVVPISRRTNATSVSFCTHNVNSVAKYDAIIASTCVADCDVSALQQTRLRPSDYAEAGSLPSHFCVRNDSTVTVEPNTRPARGSLLHTHKRLGPVLDSVCGNTPLFELTAAQIETSEQLGRRTIAINLYIASPAQPSGMQRVVDAIIETLQHFGENAKSALIVVMGDFNCDCHRATDASAQAVLSAGLSSLGLFHASQHLRKTHDAGAAIDQVRHR
ncbi:MAG: hypothetical protein WDW38_000615 [Sanguina aurantia]